MNRRPPREEDEPPNSALNQVKTTQFVCLSGIRSTRLLESHSASIRSLFSPSRKLTGNFVSVDVCSWNIKSIGI